MTDDLKRVYRLRVDGRTSTAFTIVRAGKQYLVTTKHAVVALQGMGGDVELFYDGAWQSIESRVVGLAVGAPDIAVLRLPLALSHPTNPHQESMGGVLWTQEILFVGFPQGLTGDIGALFEARPYPLAKKGALSGNNSAKSGEFYIDMYNTNGMSGAPGYFHHIGGPSLNVKLGFVLSSYRHTTSPVLTKNGDETGDVVQINTGISIAYSIKHAIDIIEQHQGGFPIA